MPCAPHVGHRPWPLVHSTAVRCLSQTLLHTRGSCRAVGGLRASPPQTEGVSSWHQRALGSQRVGSFFFFFFLSMLPVCSEFNRGQNWGRCGEMGSLVLRWWEWKLVQPFGGHSSINSQHRQVPTQHFCSLVQPRETRPGEHQGMSTEMLRAAPLTRVPNWEQPNSPSPGECAGPPSSPGMSLHGAVPKSKEK